MLWRNYKTFINPKRSSKTFKKASVYRGCGNPSILFGKFPVTQEEQTAIDIFLIKKVTNKKTIDTVALTLWLLQRHYGEGKLR